MAVLFFGTGHRISEYRNKRDVFFITLSGTSMAVNWLLLYEAFTLIGVSVATIINFCAPIIVVVLSPLIFRERLTLRKLLALALAVTGVFLISGQAVSHGLSVRGLLLALCAMVMNAAMVIFNKLSRETKGIEQCGASAGCGAHCRTVIFAVRGDSIFRFRWETGFQSCGWGSSARHSVICSFFHHRETSRPDRIALRLSGACFGSCFSGSHTERNDDAGADSRSGIDRGRRCLGRRAVQKIYAV